MQDTEWRPTAVLLNISDGTVRRGCMYDILGHGGVMHLTVLVEGHGGDTYLTRVRSVWAKEKREEKREEMRAQRGVMGHPYRKAPPPKAPPDAPAAGEWAAPSSDRP